jgi:hypothetical protein
METLPNTIAGIKYFTLLIDNGDLPVTSVDLQMIF